MSDEIKEILDFDFASQGERIEINEYERDILKDYITNLQEYYIDHVNKYEELIVKYSNLQKENERLNQLIKSLRGNIKDITKTSNNRKKAILDLMKKIEKLKKEIEFLKTSPFLFLKIEDDDLVRSYAFMKKELKDYKSRTEKAIELLKQDKQSASFNSAEALAINTLQGGKNE